MAQERLDIPIGIDLSPFRNAMSQVRAQVSDAPNFDLQPMAAEIERIQTQVKQSTSIAAADLSALSQQVDVTMNAAPMLASLGDLQSEITGVNTSLQAVDAVTVSPAIVPEIEAFDVGSIPAMSVQIDRSQANAGLNHLESDVQSTVAKLSSQFAAIKDPIAVTLDAKQAQDSIGRLADSMRAVTEASGVIGTLEATKAAVSSVSTEATNAQFSMAGLSRSLTAVSLAAKPVGMLSNSMGLVARTTSLAASGAAQVAAGLGLVSTIATYAAAGLSMLIAPLSGLVIIPKLIAGAFGLMFAVMLAPFKLVIGAVTLFARGMWAVLQPVVALAKFVFRLKVGLGTLKLQFALLAKFLSVLPPQVRLLVGGLVALGVAGRAGRIAMAGLAIGIRATGVAMRVTRIALKVFTFQWISAMKLTAKSMWGLTKSVAFATVAITRFAAVKAAAGLRSLGSAVGNVSSMIGGKLLSVVSSASKALIGLFAVGAGWGIKLAAEAEQAQIGFATMLKSGAAAKVVLAELEQFAASTPFQLDDLRDGAKQLLNAGVGTSELTSKLTMLGDIAAGTGKPINDFVRIFAKVKSTGKTSLETLNQLAERGVPIYTALQSQLGVSRTEMLKMIGAGKVGFNELNAAIESTATGTGVFAGGMMAQSQSVTGLFSTLKDNVGFAMRELGVEIIAAFDFKGLMAQGIGLFQSLKTGIASARPVFIATATVVKSAFSAVWEVVTVVFTGITSALGITGGNWMQSFVEWAAVASFAFKSWPDIAELAFTKVGLFLVQMGAEFVHHFTVRIPTILQWFASNFVDIFKTIGSFTGSIFTNLTTNIVNAMSAIWDFIASGGTKSLELAWKPLTDGFKNSVSELPNIPDRAIGELEKSLLAHSENLGSALSSGLADEIASNMQMLQDFQNAKVEPPTLPDITADPITTEEDDAAADTAGGKSRTDFSVASLDRGSEAALKAVYAAQGLSGDKQLKESQKTNQHLVALKNKPTIEFAVAGGVG